MDRRRELEAEIKRLEAKRGAIDDKDVRDALSSKIEQLQAELIQVLSRAQTQEEPVIAQSSVLQSESDSTEKVVEPAKPAPRSDGVARAGDPVAEVRAARLLLTRGDKAKLATVATSLFEHHPNDPDVHLLMAESLHLQRKTEDAFSLLKASRVKFPQHKGIEVKLAELSLAVTNLSDFDELMLAENSNLLLRPEEVQARTPLAIILGICFPGAGHLALAINTRGLIYLSLYVLALIWLLIQRGGVEKFILYIRGDQRGSLDALMPIMFTVGIYFVALLDLAASLKSAKPVQRKVIERPKPPVDLPFE